MSTVPLADILPWGDDSIPSEGRTILICDSTETDGRFLLHTMATQCLSNNKNNSNNNTTSTSTPSTNSKGKVLWIHCGCSTSNDIRTALKKSGCDPSKISFQQLNINQSTDTSNKDSYLDIINIQNCLSEYYMTQMDNDGFDANKTSDYDNDLNSYHNLFIKGIYLQVKEWIIHSITQYQPQSESIINPLIILDNASLLSTQVGSKLTHVLIQKIQYLLTHPPTPSSSQEISMTSTNNYQTGKGIGCFTILCSHDFDQEYYLNSTQQTKRNTNVTGGKIMQYIGCGSRGILCDTEEMTMLQQKTRFEYEYIWERSLIELADGVIDVIPLASGFARDVHGRLVFTERLGSLGWRRSSRGGEIDTIATNGKNRDVRMYQNNNFSTTTVNFCCNDNGVRAIRLRVS